jgi:hypothetical protein
MGAEPSAYAVLGLEPGADGAAIERAYKALIKEHHPDRAGGDSERAQELNRAYRELRASHRLKDDFSLHPQFPARKVGWSRTIWAAVLLMILGSAATILSLLSPTEIRSLGKVRLGADGALPKRVDVMDRPLNVAAINEATLQAVRLSQTKDEMALGRASRDCHRRLSQSRTMAQFDRCAAFDNAVILLQDRDPLRDKGAFSQIAVTGRLWSAAAGLSGDYMATDSRLRRIRVQVELFLAPPEDEGEG